MSAALRAAPVVTVPCDPRCADPVCPAGDKKIAKSETKTAKRKAGCRRSARGDAGAPASICFDFLIFRSYSPLKRLAIQTGDLRSVHPRMRAFLTVKGA